MKTTIEELQDELNAFLINRAELEKALEINRILESAKTKEKTQIIRAFSSGIREEHENGYDYFNNTYRQP